MFPHEEYLLKALNENTSITQIVQDLGSLYVDRVNTYNKGNEGFIIALQINKILDEAATEIANLGPKPQHWK